MFCPRCKAEYVEGIKHCPDCNVELVDQLPTVEFKKLKLETVFETADPAMIQIVTSILNDAQIPFQTKSEGLQTIYAFGIVKFVVNSEDAATARDLLKDLKE